MQNRDGDSSSKLEATLFGVPTFRLDGRPVALSGRKNLALLSILALTPDVCLSRVHLVSLLWPNADERSGRANLRQALSAIRAALGDTAGQLLEADPLSVLLHASALQSDVLRLEACCRNPNAEAADLPEIVGFLIAGLSGFSPEFDTWRATEETRLTALAASCLKRMAERAAARNDPAEALNCVSRALALHPLDEDLARLAMRLNVQQGHSARALEQFRLLQSRLKTELGVPPERATLDLARDIQARRHRATEPATAGLDPENRSEQDRPTTRYARAGDLSIAYQISGSGPIDLVYVQGWISNVELAWEDRHYAEFLDRLGASFRVIRLDKRGTGLSDRNVGYPELEERMEDLRAVMDASGSQRAVLLGTSEGCNLCMLFAATHPHRTAALVLFGGYAKGLWAEDYPWAKKVEQLESELKEIERNWGGPFDLSRGAPSLASDAAASDTFARLLRQSASPADAISLWRWGAEIDMRSLLPSIHVPCLVAHRSGDRWVRVEEGRYLADRIEAAEFVEFPGDDHLIWVGNTGEVVQKIEHWVSGLKSSPVPMILATCLCVECSAGSDAAAFERCVRAEAAQWRGEIVQVGTRAILLTMPGPSHAIRCADSILRKCATLPCPAGAGIHVGECQQGSIDPDGAMVGRVKRLAAQAADGQILVSQIVRGLLSGADISLRELAAKSPDDGAEQDVTFVAVVTGHG